MDTSGLTSFLTGLGNRITGTDAYTQSVTQMNMSQAEYLNSLANESTKDQAAQKSSNTFLYVTVAASLLTVGVITYLVIKKKK